MVSAALAGEGRSVTAPSPTWQLLTTAKPVLLPADDSPAGPPVQTKHLTLYT